MRPLGRHTAWIFLLTAAASAALLWRELHPRLPAEAAPPAVRVPDGPLLTARLPPTQGQRAIRGRVTRAGSPVAQAAILATGPGGEELSSLPSGCPGESALLLEGSCPEAAAKLAELAGQHRGEAPPLARTLSNPDGSFELAGLGEGRFTLWAESAGRGIAVLRAVASGSEGVELRLEPGLTLAGKVVGDHGEPLAGAAVIAFSSAHHRYFEGQTGGDGRFLIGPLPAGESTLVATFEGRLPAHAEVSSEEPSTLQLFTPVRLSGRVTRDGREAPGVKVEASTNDVTATAATDARGHFTFGGLRPGTYPLTATSEHERGTEWVALAPATDREDVEIRLIEGARLSGTVTDERRQPLAEVEIVCANVNDGGDFIARTGPDGRYHLEALPPSNYNVMALRHGYILHEPKLLQLAPGDRAAVDFTLRRGVALRGVVVDADGGPVGRAMLQAQPLAATEPALAAPREREARVESESGEDGVFELAGLVEGREYELVADAPKHPSLTRTVRAPAAGLRLELTRGGGIDGQVVNERDAPVAQALVACLPQSLALGPGMGGQMVTADAQGRFSIEGIPPGRYQVHAELVGAVSRRTNTEVEVREGQVTHVRVAFRAGHPLSGRVVDPQGAPLDNANVQATPEPVSGAGSTWVLSGDAQPTSTEARTGPDGRFELHDLPRGSYRVTVARTDYVETTRVLLHQPGGEPFTLVLHPELRVRGRVLREDGRPVTVFELDGAPFTDPEGRFDVGDPTEPQPAIVTAPGFAPGVLTIQPGASRGQPLELVLKAGRRVTGQVVDAVTGAPVPDAALELKLDEMPTDAAVIRADAHSGPAGEFTLAHVEGAGMVAVARQGYRATRARLAPGAATVTIPLQPLSAVFGTVVADRDTLRALMVGSFGSSKLTTPLRADGSFELAELEDGEYTIALWRAGPQEGAVPAALDAVHVTVPPAGRVRVDLRPRSQGATVRVRLAPGERGPFSASPLLVRGHFVPTEQLEAELQRRLGDVYSPLPGDGAVRTFEHVPTGHYTLLVQLHDAGERSVTPELDVGAGEEQSFEFNLPAPEPPQP